MSSKIAFVFCTIFLASVAAHRFGVDHANVMNEEVEQEDPYQPSPYVPANTCGGVDMSDFCANKYAGNYEVAAKSEFFIACSACYVPSCRKCAPTHRGTDPLYFCQALDRCLWRHQSCYHYKH